MSGTNTPDPLRDGRADFDFFIGEWHVYNRRLRARLQGSTDWEEFEGVLVARKVLGGLGNIDEGTMRCESGLVHGLTLRIFDPTTQQWNIYWADSVNHMSGPLTPMIGSFNGGRGLFYAQELIAGKSILVRFIWSAITPTSCRWEQAFSLDGGVSWETNWSADFTRRESAC